jgi:hypothetical protein
MSSGFRRGNQEDGVRQSKRWVVGVVLLVAVGAAVPEMATASTGLPQTQITDTPGLNEYAPAATDTWFTWERNSTARPGIFTTLAGQFGGASFKINAPGTRSGSSGIDGTTVVYTQWKPGGHTNLYLFDVLTRVRTALPAIVNTPLSDEYGPSISGDWVEFRRRSRHYYREFIYNTSTQELRKLDEAVRGSGWIESGQVNGDYVSWMRCGRITCKVRLYSISAGTTSVLSVPSGRYQFGAAVTADGTLYYGEANLGACGRSVMLIKLPLGGSPTTLESFNRGIDFESTFAYANTGGTDLYFAKLRCAPNTLDIFRVTSP